MTHGSNRSKLEQMQNISEDELLEYYIEEIMTSVSEGRNTAYGEKYAGLFSQMISARALDSIDREIKKITRYLEQNHG